MPKVDLFSKKINVPQEPESEMPIKLSSGLFSQKNPWGEEPPKSTNTNFFQILGTNNKNSMTAEPPIVNSFSLFGSGGNQVINDKIAENPVTPAFKP